MDKDIKKENQKYGLLISIITWFVRVAVGGVFIYSGYVKAVDPWGTLYKFEEYAAAMGMSLPVAILITGVFLLCILEFSIGMFLIAGCYRRATPVMLAAVIAVMLPLTLWIAVADPVPDCGCFGDALIISNWATFWKNVALSLATVWLLVYNRRCHTIISPAFQWMAVVVNAAFITAIGLIGYWRQPLVEFRAYKVGTPMFDKTAHIEEDAQSEENDDDFIFVYEKEGQRREFGIEDELPDESDGWKFIERKSTSPESKKEKSDNSGSSVASANSDNSGDRNIRLWDTETGNDVTDNLDTDRGDWLFLLIPKISEISIAQTWKINLLYDWASVHGIHFIGIADGNEKELAAWSDLSLPEYKIYTSDDTAIKEVARGNPAVVFTRDGIIKWKAALSSMDVDILDSTCAPEDAMAFDFDNRQALFNIVGIYLACIAVLIVLSMMPRAINLYSAHLNRMRSRYLHVRKKENQE